MILLDLFCKAGGCSVGYHRAGFDPMGCDIEPQVRYQFPCWTMDALEMLRRLIAGYAIDGYRLGDISAIHASPPCQGYSDTKSLAGAHHPKIVEDVRDLLKQTGKPYVIENVPGAPLINPVAINGPSVGLPYIDRERWFECSFPVPMLLMGKTAKAVKMGRPVREGDVITAVGHFSGVDYARRVMGIDWMTRDELAQAIPPAYTEYIGRHLMAHIERTAP